MSACSVTYAQIEAWSSRASRLLAEGHHPGAVAAELGGGIPAADGLIAPWVWEEDVGYAGGAVSTSSIIAPESCAADTLAARLEERAAQLAREWALLGDDPQDTHVAVTAFLATREGVEQIGAAASTLAEEVAR